MSVQAFNLVSHSISSGFTLVEASAGTGKTYSITWLVVRLLLEKKIKIDTLLIVTFTIAATDELKTRIRHKITEVLTQWHSIDQLPDTDELKQIFLNLPPKTQEQCDRALRQRAPAASPAHLS